MIIYTLKKEAHEKRQTLQTYSPFIIMNLRQVELWQVTRNRTWFKAARPTVTSLVATGYRTYTELLGLVVTQSFYGSFK
jgi:hypothetical protein